MVDVKVQNVSKSYEKGKVLALNEVSFEVEKGELFGLIGPDGAGKTSLFRILTTLIDFDQGEASVLSFDVNKDLKKIRKEVGYMPGRFSLYQDLTVEENLEFFATIFNTSIEENYDLVREIYVQIEPFKDRKAGKLSGGMKQKLALCCALIHRPKVLFLDEPTTGVDTVSRKEFWEMLKRLKEQEITILVSTPYMDEAMLCERIALIQHGSIMSIDSPKGIISKYPDPLYGIKSADMSRLLRLLQDQERVKSANSFGEYHHVSLVEPDSANMDRLLDSLRMEGLEQLEMKPIKPSIEDCFIHLMKEQHGETSH